MKVGSDVRFDERDSLAGHYYQHFTQGLIYVYDFLSMWTFFVEFGDLLRDDGQSYPNTLF